MAANHTRDDPATAADHTARGLNAYLVASGILASRFAGLLREMVFAHYFGNSHSADAFRAAIRIPNFLQNLFGEGVLSASFIPVYSRLLAQGDSRQARAVAGSVAALLTLLTGVFVALGILAAPWLVDLLAPGFAGEKREAVVELVRILFPGTGFLVLSAWCLGILNSHRKFFLSYAAPVVWNAAILAAMLTCGRHYTAPDLAVIVAWAAVAGSAMQLLLQLPGALKAGGRPTLELFPLGPPVRTVVRSFFPVMIGRGVVQVSAYIDNIIASFLPGGALAAFGYAQVLYLLPVSLFGMSVSAAELPELSALDTTDAAQRDVVRRKLGRAAERITFFVVPTLVAYILLGDCIVGTLFESGRFTAADTRYVWLTLAAASLGLLAATKGRLYASSLYAVNDTKTPLRCATVRVAAASVLGYFCALELPRLLEVPAAYGIAGLSFASMLGGWIELLLLRRAVTARLGPIPRNTRIEASIWTAAIASGAVGTLMLWLAEPSLPFLRAAAGLVPFGVTYLVLAWVLGIPELQQLLRGRR